MIDIASSSERLAPLRLCEASFVLELARLDFVRRRDDLVITGKSGTGKSHILKAFALRACEQGIRMRGLPPLLAPARAASWLHSSEAALSSARARILYAVAMADKGYRSVEVIVLNDTPGDLAIEGVGDTPDEGAWVDTEKPTNGLLLKQYSSRTFGVKTDDVNGVARGSFQLTGLGSSPLQIDFWNRADGTSDVSVTANNAVHGTTQAIESNEDNHTMFQVQLVPSVPPPRR